MTGGVEDGAKSAGVWLGSAMIFDASARVRSEYNRRFKRACSREMTEEVLGVEDLESMWLVAVMADL